MAHFRYKVINDSGQVTGGTVRLPYDNETTVIAYLEREGNTVLFIKRLSALNSQLLEMFSSSSRTKVKRKEVAEFLSNLSVMLRSGIPIIGALKELVDENENPALKAASEGMLFHLESGASFFEAVGNYKKIFSSTVRYLVRIGEETGSLEKTLKDAAEHVQHLDQIISDTKQALLYPAFVIVTMSAAVGFWFSYVVPKIVGLFKEMDVALPQITLTLLAISEFLQNYFLWIVVGLVLLVVSISTAKKHHGGFRLAFDRTLLKIPLINSIVSASNLAFISEYLRLLLNSGVDTFRSLDILSESLKNEYYRARVLEVRRDLVNGQALAESFRNATIFPTFVVRMVSIGEQSGTLPEQLSHIAEEYQQRLSTLVATLGKVIEPVVLVVAGVMFAIILGGVFLPIYDLIGQIG
jgi:type II secretory pathway component PulF